MIPAADATQQKSTNLSATLPKSIQEFTSIRDARFLDSGDHRLAVTLAGEVRIDKEHIQRLSEELKQRLPAK